LSKKTAEIYHSTTFRVCCAAKISGLVVTTAKGKQGPIIGGLNGNGELYGTFLAVNGQIK
jgi:hypothetical protein